MGTESMPEQEPMTAQDMVDHLKNCRKVDAAIVHESGINGTPTVQTLLDAGWTYEGTEYIGGKRIRYLRAPS